LDVLLATGKVRDTKNEFSETDNIDDVTASSLLTAVGFLVGALVGATVGA
jgi:hypothetical protein